MEQNVKEEPGGTAVTIELLDEGTGTQESSLISTGNSDIVTADGLVNNTVGATVSCTSKDLQSGSITAVTIEADVSNGNKIEVSPREIMYVRRRYLCANSTNNDTVMFLQKKKLDVGETMNLKCL